MTEPSTYKLLQKITEVQVEVAKINERLESIPEWREETRHVAEQADSAEDTAQQALRVAKNVRADAERAREERKSDRRWLIGTALTLLALIVPIALRFYT